MCSKGQPNSGCPINDCTYVVTLWLIHDYSVKEFNGGGIGLLFKYSGKSLTWHDMLKRLIGNCFEFCCAAAPNHCAELLDAHLTLTCMPLMRLDCAHHNKFNKYTSTPTELRLNHANCWVNDVPDKDGMAWIMVLISPYDTGYSTFYSSGRGYQSQLPEFPGHSLKLWKVM